MLITDLEGTILAINEKSTQIFGKNRDELIGTSVYENIGINVGIKRRKIIEKVIKSKKQMELINNDKERWWKVKIKPIFNNERAIVKILYYLRDITEEKTIELNLKKSEIECEDTIQKLKTITENIKVGLYYTDVKGNFLWANKTAADIIGRSRKEMIGKNGRYLLDVKSISKKDYIKALKLLTHLKIGKKAGPAEFNIKDKDGVKKIVEIQTQKIKLHGKNVIVGIVNDITNRKKAEKEIKEEKERTEKYLNLAGTIILALDSKGNIILLNKKGYETLGYKKGELSGKNWFETCIPKELADEVKNVFFKCMDGKIEYVEHFENPILRRDGKIRTIDWYNTIIKDHDGKIIGTLSSGEDITERKKAEKQMKENKEYLQKIIDSTSELIFTVDKDFKIKTWNKTAVNLTGYKKNDIVGRSIEKIDLFDYPEEIHEVINNIRNKKTIENNEISINTIYGIKRIFSISPSYISDESDDIIEVLFICSDITNEKEVHDNLKDGHCYLIEDNLIDTALDIFKDMLKMKHEGLLIERGGKEHIKEFFNRKPPHIIRLTSSKDEKYPTINNPDELYEQIKNFLQNNKETVILIDRIDYLLTNNSFETIMKTLYKINDLIENNKSILLLRLDTSYLNNNQIALLKQEIEEIPKEQISDVIIDEELFDIIRYIYDESKRNIYVNYGKISNKFSLSKVTTKKRIENLIDKDLIISKKHGKTKILFLTNKGNKMINRKTVL